MGKKTLEELVFHDDFMFAVVMMDAENCRYYHSQMDVEMLEKDKNYSDILQYHFFSSAALTAGNAIIYPFYE